ncbi:MAG: hypothetical protein R3C44_14360 [Chloroflexota bacterium]
MPVTIKITSDDRLEIGPNQVTFTPDNWSTPQQITVRAPGGGADIETREATITHTLSSADSRVDVDNHHAGIDPQLAVWLLPAIVR